MTVDTWHPIGALAQRILDQALREPERKTVPIDAVVRALRSFPDGATTRELAVKLGMRPDSLGPRLSKQYLWGRGLIDREERTVVAADGTHHEFVWRAR